MRFLICMLITGIITITPLEIHGQSNYWIKAIGGADKEYAPSIQVISDGYMVIGHTKSFGAGDFDFLAVKINKDGEIVWSKTIGGHGEEKAFCIEPTDDGGYIVVGNTRSFGAGNYDFLVVKLNKNLGIDWAKTIGNEGMDMGFYAKQAEDGGYIVIGNTQPFGKKGKEVLIVKLDRDGNLLWAKRIGGGNFFYGVDGIQKTNNGGYILNGVTNSLGYKSSDALILKLDKDFNLQWARAIGGTKKDTTNWNGVRQTSDGGYIFAGETESFNKGDYSGWIVKLKPDGNLEWNRVLDNGEDEALWAVNETSDGGFITAGVGGRPTSLRPAEKKRPQEPVSTQQQGERPLLKRGIAQGPFRERPEREQRSQEQIATDSREPLPSDIILAKFNKNGNLLWTKAIGGPESGLEEVEEVIEIEDGYILAGITEAFGTGKGDFFVAKLNRDGLINGCEIIKDLSPTITSPTPECKEISPEIVSVSPSVNLVSPTVTTPDLQVKEAQSKTAVNEQPLPLQKKKRQKGQQRDERWWLNKQTGSISGKVTDINNAPLEGVEVSIFGTDLRAVTDKGGNCKIENVLPAAPRYILIAKKNGFFDAQTGNINVTEGGVTTVNLNMQAESKEYSHWKEKIDVMICYIIELKPSQLKQPSQDAVLDPTLYPDKVKPYLKPGKYIDSDNEIVKNVATQIINTIPETDRKKQTVVAKVVYDWVVKNIHYDLMNNFPGDVTCGNWQSTHGGWGNSFAEWLYLPSDVITQRRAICIEYERLATALLRAVGIPARPAPLRAHPVTQWWVQLPNGDGYWANMETSVGHTKWEEKADLWARFPSRTDNSIAFYPVNEDAPIHVDWWTDNPCLWLELYGQRQDFDFTESRKKKAEDAFYSFERTGRFPKEEKTMDPKRIQKETPYYEISSRGCSIDLANIGNQDNLIVRFPVFYDTEYVKVLKFTHWTNHPECVVRTWIEEEKDSQTGEVLKWYNVEFKLILEMKHVEEKEEETLRKRPEGVPTKDEIPMLVRRLKMLIQEKKAQGVDTSSAERLDEQSRQAMMRGDEEECIRLLKEAIGLLE